MGEDHRRRSLNLRRFLGVTGYLPWLLLAALLVASLAHHFSRLPSEYTWLQPLRALKGVAQREWFPSLVMVAVGLGWLARPLAWRTLRDGVAGLRSWPSRGSVARATGGAITGVLLVLASGGTHNLADFACGGMLGALVVFIRQPAAAVRRLAVDATVVVVLFTVCSYVFTVIKALLFTVGEIEDSALVSFEEMLFGTALHRPVAAWASEHPQVVVVLDDVYFRLFEHMSLTSLFLVGAGMHRERTRLWASLALCYLLGGPLYYIIPGVGPRFVEADLYLFMDRLPLASNVIQSALFRNTHAVVQGVPGPVSSYAYLACMPSLHMAHEFVLLYYARSGRVFFGISLVFTLVTSIAILALGWHYAIDILGGLFLALLALAIVRVSRDRLLPRIVFQRGCYLPSVTDR